MSIAFLEYLKIDLVYTLLFQVGTKRLKVQHKQIVKGSAANDVYITSEGAGNNVDPSDISSSFETGTSEMNGNLGSACFQEGKNQRQNEGILSNLEDLGEALPDVSA